jgi:hypothetical protein
MLRTMPAGAQRIRLDLPRHPRFKDFEAFAARAIFPRLAEMEDDRKRAVKRVCHRAFAVAATVAALQVLAFGVIGTDAFIGVGVLGIPPAIIGGVFAAQPLRRVRADLKQFLITETCKHLGLRYSGMEPALPFDRFVAARLLPKHGGPSFQDGIECSDAAMRFSAAETTLWRSITGLDSRGDNTLWRGLLVALPAPRPLSGRTLVMSERAAIEQFFDGRRAEPIDLGYGDLAAGLEIRTTDPDEARAVLTERVMRRIADLARRLGRERLSLALFEGDILLAIETRKDRFEGGSVNAPLAAAARMNQLLAELALLFELAEAVRDAFDGRPSQPA